MTSLPRDFIKQDPNRRLGRGVVRRGTQRAFIEKLSGNMMEASFRTYNGWETGSLALEMGETLVCESSFDLESGTMQDELLDPAGSGVRSLAGKSGTVEWKVAATGTYKVKLIGEHASGRYSIRFDVKQ